MFGKKKKPTSNFTTPRRRLVDYDIEEGTRPESHYRRNQTVSGYKKPEINESDRQKSHSLAERRRRLGLVFLVVFAVIALLFVGLWQFIAKPLIVFDDTSITKPIDASEYKATISDYLDRNPSQRTKVTLNGAALSAYVIRFHSEVSSVTVYDGFTLPSEAKFLVSFRKPLAGWQNRGNQYFVDKDGVVFDVNYFSDPTVKVVDESGISAEQGSSVASARMLGFLGKVVDRAESRGYKVVEAILPPDMTRRIDIKLEGRGAVVRFTTDRGVGAQVEDMDNALKFFAERGGNPQYIDVRVAGRSAYK